MSAEPAPSLPTGPALETRVEEILSVFAQEARVERSALHLEARADELGASSLDLALALFELEARFGVTLPEPEPGEPMPTIGQMVQQVLDAQRAVAAMDHQTGEPASDSAAGSAASPPQGA